MQIHTIIDDTLIQQAKQLSDLQTEHEIIEAALKLWVKTKQLETQYEDTAADVATAFSNFISCAHGDSALSETYKETLTASLRNKHDNR